MIQLNKNKEEMHIIKYHPLRTLPEKPSGVKNLLRTVVG